MSTRNSPGRELAHPFNNLRFGYGQGDGLYNIYLLQVLFIDYKTNVLQTQTQTFPPVFVPFCAFHDQVAQNPKWLYTRRAFSDVSNERDFSPFSTGDQGDLRALTQSQTFNCITDRRLNILDTILVGTGKKVVIGDDRPTVLIGERINPTGKKKLSAALGEGDLSVVHKEALAQVEAGADVLDVNVGAAGVDEVDLLPKAVKLVMETVNVPLCIDTANIEAMAAALAVHKELAPEGKPLINSINGEEERLQSVLPLVAEYGAAVIGLCMDDDGIPDEPERRLAVATKIVERAGALGVPPEDIVLDCLALTVGADSKAGWKTLETIRLVKQELGVNITLGASNVSFGLPARDTINGIFIAMAIQNGMTCAIVNAEHVRSFILAADLSLGRDEYAMRYIKAFRKRRKK